MKTVKPLILVLAIVFASVTATAQDFSKYETMKDVTSMVMTSKMFKLLNKIDLQYKEKIYEALKAIKVELNKIVLEGISTEELQKAKDNIRGRLILKLESATAKLNFYASQELLGERIKEIEEVLIELDKVTLKQVNKIDKLS